MSAPDGPETAGAGTPKPELARPADLSAFIHLLGDILGRVIQALESRAAFEAEERIRRASKARRAGEAGAGERLAAETARLAANEARAVASAFTLYFDLINLAEENDRVAKLAAEEERVFPEPLSESVEAAVTELKRAGVSDEEMARLLDGLSIELVLTAHPTEAKRRTVLSKLSRIARRLKRLTAPGLGRREEIEAIVDIEAEISALWLTDRLRTTRPAVTDEVRTGLFYIDEVFWNLLPRVGQLLDRALARHYPGLSARPDWLRLGSWIGGDRDGNPNVVATVTAETFRLHRGLAVEKHRAALSDLARRLSVSGRRLPPPEALLEWIERQRPFPPHAAYIEERYRGEPFRLALALLAAQLETASGDDMRANLFAAAPHRATVNDTALRFVLETVRGSLPPPLAASQVDTLRRQARVFGLHAAGLHLREESGRLAACLAEILRALSLEPAFEKLDRANKLGLLGRLLAAPPPVLAGHPGVSAATAETFALFQLVTRARLIYGQDLVGPFIISMTHGAADVLTALLLAAWAGCADCLAIVPLFETMDDLKAAPAVLAEMFSDPAYRAHLTQNDNRQTVMIGYSDTNKDGGYLAANWALYRAQEEIVRAARTHGVTVTIFHGRGGTTARGGGPSNRAIRAQPPGSIDGRLILTEQGEVISSTYSNRILARRHVEQIAHAVLLASSPRSASAQPANEAWRSALEAMAAAAYAAYRSLVFESPGFAAYWHAATPIDEIRRLRMGSRPSERNAERETVFSSRAIPWVFSWMQSRFNLPGWYGLGEGLAAAVPLSLQREMYASWPFFATLIDNTAMSLKKADMEIAGMYSALVPDQTSARSLFGRIAGEYERTRDAVLRVTEQSALLEGDPGLRLSLRLRDPYIDPLNYLQVDMLRRLRPMSDQESAEAQALREVIVVTINGIAAGLRNTG